MAQIQYPGFGDVNFIDSTGIGFLAATYNSCQKGGLSKSLVFQRKSMTFSSVCG